jgi:hypothetical protein
VASCAAQFEPAPTRHLASTGPATDHQESIVAYSIAFFDMVFAGGCGDGLSAKRPDVTELKAKRSRPRPDIHAVRVA